MHFFDDSDTKMEDWCDLHYYAEDNVAPKPGTAEHRQIFAQLEDAYNKQ